MSLALQRIACTCNMTYLGLQTSYNNIMPYM
jgi:hypothetical protein